MMANENYDDSLLDQGEPVPTQEDYDSSDSGGVLPPGEYLCDVEKVRGRMAYFNSGAVPQASLVLKVVEPEQYKGRLIFHDVSLWHEGEKTDDWSAKKRWATLKALKMVASKEEAAGFKWKRLEGMRVVFRGRHKLYEKDGMPKKVLEPEDWTGLHSEGRWLEDACEKAPQDWPARDSRKGGDEPEKNGSKQKVGAGSGKTRSDFSHL
ncbi:MAG: hypothetical protein AB7S36_20920 [Planctomycetota bacterium]